MKYSGILAKNERERIFSLFQKEQKLKFAQIEKMISIRSNMLSYHLTEMMKEKILVKKGEFYELTEMAEKYLPIFSHVTGKELSPLPIVLVAAMKNNKILLIKRKNRPYKDYWCMPGGKMKLEESFDDAALRIVKEKTGLYGKFVSMNSILHEKVKGEKVKYSFILFFVKVEIKTPLKKTEDIQMVELNQLSKINIIPSDMWLIKHKLKSKIPIYRAEMNEENEILNGFEVKKM
jgi:ADP-ribose pyrophosphatase YjhB (NUDIX family)